MCVDYSSKGGKERQGWLAMAVAMADQIFCSCCWGGSITNHLNAGGLLSSFKEFTHDLYKFPPAILARDVRAISKRRKQRKQKKIGRKDA